MFRRRPDKFILHQHADARLELAKEHSMVNIELLPIS